MILISTVSGLVGKRSCKPKEYRYHKAAQRGGKKGQGIRVSIYRGQIENRPCAFMFQNRAPICSPVVVRANGSYGFIRRFKRVQKTGLPVAGLISISLFGSVVNGEV